MILTRDNEYAALLDTCVLAPMPLCDTLLRLAEDPALYRPLWSKETLQELDRFMAKRKYTPRQRERRIRVMTEFFPEASVSVSSELVEAMSCIPDPKDRHVLAAAVSGHANAIITFNTSDFSEQCLKQYNILPQHPDEFLVHQFHLSPELILEKIDYQAATLRNTRTQVLDRLAKQVPNFAQLVRNHT